MKAIQVIGGLGVGIAALMLSGCNLEEDKASDEDSGSAQLTGRMTLRVSDTPIDSADKVVVVFTGVTVKPESGTAVDFEFDAPRSIDLLSLQGSATETLLDGVTLDAGHYEWMRLHLSAEEGVNDSYIEIDGAQHELAIPSGDTTGLKLVDGFDIPEGDALDMTLDFDLRQGVVHNAQGYMLKPTLRFMDDDDTGTIDGSIDSGLLSADCSAALYVYAGADVTPGDIGGDGVEPIVTKSVDTSATGVTEYGYELAFIATGEYTLAFTCEASADDAEAADQLTWLATQNVTLSAGETVSVDFVPQ